MTEFLILHKIQNSDWFPSGRPVCFRGTYLFNTRMHFADIQIFPLHSFWKYVFLKDLIKSVTLCTIHSDIVKVIFIITRADCCLNVATIPMCSSSRTRNQGTTEGVNRHYGEGDTDAGHEQHEQMNCMSIMSRPHQLSLPIWHSAPRLRPQNVTGSGHTLSISSPLFDRSCSTPSLVERVMYASILLSTSQVLSKIRSVPSLAPCSAEYS